MTWWTIPIPPKTGNGQYGAQRGGRKFLLPCMSEWRLLVKAACARGPVFKGGKYTMYMMTYFPDESRRRDSSNYLKVVEDALQHAGVLDDDHNIVNHVLSKTVDKDNPRIMVAMKIDEPWAK